jgi:hypothetical protein
VVLFANDPYVVVLIVVDARATPVLVARVDVPAALYNFTVYDDALVTASHATSSDFAVEDVAVTVIEDGAASVTGGANTDTAKEAFVRVPLPSDPCWFRPQHLMVESVKTAHVWTYPEEI